MPEVTQTIEGRYASAASVTRVLDELFGKNNYKAKVSSMARSEEYR